MATSEHAESAEVRVLRAARALIEKPESWARGELARNASGAPVWDHATEARAFSILGAIYRASEQLPNVGVSPVTDALDLLQRCLPAGLYAEDYNDAPETSHEDVLALLDRAIAIGI